MLVCPLCGEGLEERPPREVVLNEETCRFLAETMGSCRDLRPGVYRALSASCRCGACSAEMGAVPGAAMSVVLARGPVLMRLESGPSGPLVRMACPRPGRGPEEGMPYEDVRPEDAVPEFLAAVVMGS